MTIKRTRKKKIERRKIEMKRDRIRENRGESGNEKEKKMLVAKKIGAIIYISKSIFTFHT